ncbi:hypothetical protein JYU34_012040 [Plutella xylostella]|uniref:Uncharacterized protein n=1 Tax=Plutella xylostella TaxID=51655 RepID=A0ABQ7QEN2_PLUXY|nr:hypothetical protein JYU34_012040 [Plutella xylostella]
MALLYLCIGLLIQGSFILCEDVAPAKAEPAVKVAAAEAPELVAHAHTETHAHDAHDAHTHDAHAQAAQAEFFSKFFGSSPFYPTSSVAMMSQINDSDKTPEEQIKEIKELAHKIGNEIQSEMANLMRFAMTCLKYEHDHELNPDPEHKPLEGHVDTNEIRDKRSTESPMDSTKLIMRLLNHIKSSNEYQNIAIEKMMTAQQIADKFGIEFNPDPDVLTELAYATNEKTQELTDILKDACEPKNATVEVAFVPLEGECKAPTNVSDKGAYYGYSVQPHHEHAQGFVPIMELIPEQVHRPARAQPRRVETQIPPPPAHAHPAPHHHTQPHPAHPQPHPAHPQPHFEQPQQYRGPPVTPKPAFYEPPMMYTPAPEYYPGYCPEFEPFTAAAIVIEEIELPEPELVAEEIEETVSSRMLVEHEAPGVATVSHVMTYTVEEKAHFRTPQIEELPEHVQYSFLLM